ncbi:response regulator [Arsenicicoccus dermatophilus]|uniref:response regulator transcription factor n=1 Tax=Arsenicicoccus dermatophilus TaxID=1076331 RepID=UPI001F4CC2DE|nr:response regulator transcription factor [Arsenicicoccus dermatophilus]MCH8612189.1 response regulator transcription factor [Arsenicicoccus dermatophilus]
MTVVMVCDDAPLTREVMMRRIGSLPGVTRVCGASSGEELLAKYATEQPTLTLTDLRMPGMGGLDAVKRLLALRPNAQVMMMTLAEDIDGVARALSYGAKGYVMKDSTREELAVALAPFIGEAMPRAHRGGPLAGAPATLTARELEVLRGMSQGQSNAEIGAELYLTEDTIKTHARRLFRKLDASDRAHAVAIAYRSGLIS